MGDWPEHEKLDETLKLSEFTQRLRMALDYDDRYVLMKPRETNFECICGNGHLYRVSTLSRALADLFDVDYDKLMAEKDAMLEQIREANRD